MYIKEIKHTKAKFSSLSGMPCVNVCVIVCGLTNHAYTYHRIHELRETLFFVGSSEECFLSYFLSLFLPLRRLPALFYCEIQYKCHELFYFLRVRELIARRHKRE